MFKLFASANTNIQIKGVNFTSNNPDNYKQLCADLSSGDINIKQIQFSNCKFSNETFTTIINLLSGHDVSELSFICCNINDDMLNNCESLWNNFSNLKKILLRTCEITDASESTLINLINKIPSLVYLGLNGNNLDESTQSICDAICCSNISSCDIDNLNNEQSERLGQHFYKLSDLHSATSFGI